MNKKMRKTYEKIMRLMTAFILMIGLGLPLRNIHIQAEASPVYGVRNVNLSPFIYFQYQSKNSGSDYYFYGAGLELTWLLDPNAREGTYFDLTIPPEVILDRAPNSTTPFFQVMNADGSEVVLNVYKIQDPQSGVEKLRFVATSYVETHPNLSGTSTIGQHLDNSKIRGYTVYGSNSAQTSTGNANFYSGFRPNKRLFKSSDQSSSYRASLNWTSQYQDQPSYTIADETDVNYYTEVNGPGQFGDHTIYGIKETSDSVTWGYVFNANGRNTYRITPRLSFDGFNGSIGFDPTAAKRTVELYNPNDIQSNFKWYKGTPSGSIVPNNLQPVSVQVVDGGSRPATQKIQYEFTFPEEGTYYAEIKTRKKKTIKDNNGEDAYFVGLRAENWRHTLYTEDYFHPTSGMGRANAVYHETPPPADVNGNVIVRHIKIENGTPVNLVPDEMVKENRPVGEAYETSQRSFDGYRYVRLAGNSAPANGLVEAGTLTVTYIYEPIPRTGTVIVTYEDENGNEIPGYPPLTIEDESPVGKEYQTTPPTIPGYVYTRHKEDSAPERGQVPPGTSTVTYVYRKIGGKVEVKHIDTTGKVLKDVATVKENAPVGEEYTTHEEVFEGYRYKELLEGSDPASGTVGEQPKLVTYVYEKIGGRVEVKHIDTTGKVLKDVATVKENAPVGEEYTTHEEVFEGYRFKQMASDSDPASGTVGEQPKLVVYVYEKIGGKVEVKHIDTTGRVLKDVATVKENAPVGEEYTTNKEVFEGYRYKKLLEGSDPASGTVGEQPKLVVYVYEKIGGRVEVKHIDTTGKVLKDVSTVKEDAPVGEEYSTNQVSFPGYRFKKLLEGSAPANGTVSEQPKLVTYVYEKIGGKVEVKHVDTTGKVLKDVATVKENAPVGEEYTTNEEVFKGYRFKKLLEGSAPANGTVGEQPKLVTYVYEKIGGKVEVKHVDTTGKVLKDVATVKENAPVGEEYSTTEENFEGYRFKKLLEGSAPANGTVGEQPKLVTYVYEKIGGKVEVKHVDTTGKVLKDVATVKENVPVGEEYTTTEENFEGYRFKKLLEGSDPANGTVGEQPKLVTYVYEKVGSVVVTYEDDKGNEIPGHPPVTVVDNEPVGNRYETTPPTIPGYVYDHHKPESDSPSGEVVEHGRTVTYVYKKIGGTVSVVYVDNKGNVLSKKEVVVKDQPIGDPYTTVQKTFENYRFVRMDPNSAPYSGTVNEEDQLVIYVYEPVEVKTSVPRSGTPKTAVGLEYGLYGGLLILSAITGWISFRRKKD